MYRRNGASAHVAPFTFDDLLYEFGPNPDAIPNLWKKSFDISSRTALLYQLDLLSATPRIKKAVRITSLNDAHQQTTTKPSLTATVFIDGQAMSSNYVSTLIGKEYLSSPNELTCLLERLGKEMPYGAPQPQANTRQERKFSADVFTESIFVPSSMESQTLPQDSRAIIENATEDFGDSFNLLPNTTSEFVVLNSVGQTDDDLEDMLPEDHFLEDDDKQQDDVYDGDSPEENGQEEEDGQEEKDPDFVPERPATSSSSNPVTRKRARPPSSSSSKKARPSSQSASKKPAQSASRRGVNKTDTKAPGGRYYPQHYWRKPGPHTTQLVPGIEVHIQQAVLKGILRRYGVGGQTPDGQKLLNALFLHMIGPIEEVRRIKDAYPKIGAVKLLGDADAFEAMIAYTEEMFGASKQFTHSRIVRCLTNLVNKRMYRFRDSAKSERQSGDQTPKA